MSCNTKHDESPIPKLQKKDHETTSKSLPSIESNLSASSDTNNSSVPPPDESLSIQDKIEYYKNQDEYVKAISLVDSLINKDPLNENWWSTKAMLHFENDDTTNAIIAYEKAVAIFPLAEDNLTLALLYAGKGNPKCLSITKEIASGGKGTLNPKINFIKGIYYNHIGKKELAIDAFDRCIHDNFTFMEAYKEKALILCSINRCLEGINTLIKAVTIKNSYQDGYYYLGECYEQIGETAKAIEAYQTALLYNPHDKQAEDCLKRLTE
jgi:tetratricopeptide (TPR) repeat protein